MPEIVEVELYRRLLERVVGRTVRSVDADDAWFLKGGLVAEDLRTALVGRRIVATGRRGKLLVAECADGTVLGLRFGMTGRLVVDGVAAIDALTYGPAVESPTWDRFRLHLADGGVVRLNDPRRLGGVELDPDLDRLGPDAFTVSLEELADALAGSSAPLKARLMDQSRVAGIGNLTCDEVLWQAGLDPARPAGGLGPAELERLHRQLGATLATLMARGGSHTGDLQPARVRGARCPRDGAPLAWRTIGGRTTLSCPRHQR